MTWKEEGQQLREGLEIYRLDCAILDLHTLVGKIAKNLEKLLKFRNIENVAGL